MRIGVIGAGFGGVTTSIALWALGADVQLFEESRVMFAPQAYSSNRVLHPYIYDWPAEGCMISRTNLPFMNWETSTAKEVAQRLRREFNYYVKQSKGSLKFVPDCGRLSVQNQGNKIHIIREGGPLIRDLVVLAVGFGTPRNLSPRILSDYWQEDNLETKAAGKVLISGTGDGGLVDLIRLAITTFDQKHFVEEIFSLNEGACSDEHIGRLLVRLRRLRTFLSGSVQDLDSASSHLSEEFRKLEDMEGYKRVRKAISHRLRRSPNFELKLNGRHTSYLSRTASMLHLFLAYILNDLRAFKYQAGHLTTQDLGDRVEATFHDAGTNETYVECFDHVLLRHGLGTHTGGDVGRLMDKHRVQLEALKTGNSHRDHLADMFGVPLSSSELTWWREHIRRECLIEKLKQESRSPWAPVVDPRVAVAKVPPSQQKKDSMSNDDLFS